MTVRIRNRRLWERWLCKRSLPTSLSSLSLFSLSLSARECTHSLPHTHTHSLAFSPSTLIHTHSLVSRMPFLLSFALHTYLHNDESHLQQAAMEAVDMRAVCLSPPLSSLSLFSPSLCLSAARALVHTHIHTVVVLALSLSPALDTHPIHAQ